MQRRSPAPSPATSCCPVSPPAGPVTRRDPLTPIHVARNVTPTTTGRNAGKSRRNSRFLHCAAAADESVQFLPSGFLESPDFGTNQRPTNCTCALGTVRRPRLHAGPLRLSVSNHLQTARASAAAMRALPQRCHRKCHNARQHSLRE
jgi:hypothetical protein